MNDARMKKPADVDVQNLRAGSVQVAAERGGIALVFGSTPSPPAGETGSPADPPERMVLSLTAGRHLRERLLDALRSVGRAPEEAAAAARPASRTAGSDPNASQGTGEIAASECAPPKTTYVNSMEILGACDAVKMSFGVQPAPRASQEATVVGPKMIISVTLAVAAQLAADLGRVVAATRPTGETAPPINADPADTRLFANEVGHDAAYEERVAKVLTLLRQVGRLDAKLDFEPSVKTIGGRVFHDRFLLGFNRRESGGRRDDRITSICGNIGMPRGLLAPFEERLADANHVYFGVEKADRTLLLKVYLEFRDHVAEEAADSDGAGRPVQLFTGFKWDSFRPERRVVSRYLWYPALPAAGIVERLREAVDAEARHAGLVELAQALATRASRKIPASDIQYLEVAEEGNPRRSFDLNVYKSALRLEDVCADLLRALPCVDVPFHRFEPVYRRIRNERFGHLAGGIDRENKDFLTVYYGVKEIHSSQLATARLSPEERPPRPRW